MLTERIRYLQDEVLASLMKGERPGICPFDLTITELKEELELEQYVVNAQTRAVVEAEKASKVEYFDPKPNFPNLLSRNTAIFKEAAYEGVRYVELTRKYSLSPSRISQIVQKELRRHARKLSKYGLFYPEWDYTSNNYRYIYAVRRNAPDGEVMTIESDLTLVQATLKADELNSKEPKVPVRKTIVPVKIEFNPELTKDDEDAIFNAMIRSKTTNKTTTLLRILPRSKITKIISKVHRRISYFAEDHGQAFVVLDGSYETTVQCYRVVTKVNRDMSLITAGTRLTLTEAYALADKFNAYKF